MRPFSTAPTLDELTRIAEEELETLPAAVLERLSGVGIGVEELPDEALCEEMALDSPFDLLGLYVGTPWGEKGAGDTPQHVDRILLFRRPILDYWCDSGEDLRHVVRHVLVHEIGHHMGFSDDEMAAIEAD